MTPRALEAVFFDLDGVLIDSEHAWDAARRAVTEQAGGRWRPGATEAMMGMSSAEWSAYLHDELGVPLAPERINELVVARLLAGYKRELPVLPGAIAAVHRLAERWPLGLASSSNRPVIDAVLALSGLADSFAVTVSGDDVRHGKPAPDIYEAAAGRLGVAAAASAAIEDSSNGVRAGAAAGMLVIAVPNKEFPPAQDALTLAATSIDSLDELTPALLDGLVARDQEFAT